MKKLALISALVLISLNVTAQREGPPRRMENPQTQLLAGGARVEFKSFDSPALGGPAHYSVFLPPGYEENSSRRYPVIYFLHGIFNDHTSWVVERYGKVAAQVAELVQNGRLPAFIMIHPDGQNSLYTNYADGSRRYEDYITDDLIDEVEKQFPCRKGRQARSIGGVSMGAYGALKIALKHPAKFASVAAVSPIILLGEEPMKLLSSAPARMASYYAGLFGPAFGNPFNRSLWRDNSLEHLASSVQVDDLQIFFAYGTADRYAAFFPMEEGILRFHQTLQSRGIPHTYRSYPGEPHGWELVGDHLQEILQFLTQTFKSS